MKIKVLPRSDNYAKANKLTNTIYLSNGLLEFSNDNELIGTIYHEIFHLKSKKKDFIISCSFWVFFVAACFLLVPYPILCFCLGLLLYIVFYLYLKFTEHQADLFVYRECGKEVAFEFLADINKNRREKHLIRNIFEWHPTVEQRVNFLFPGVKALCQK